MKKKRKLRSLLVFWLLISVLLGVGFGLRSFILQRIKASLEASVSFGQIHLTVLPPTVVIDDIRTLSSSPFFSARKITIRFSPLILLRRDKSLRVYIEQPVLRISESSRDGAKEKSKRAFSLPFSIENGVVREGEIYFEGKSVSYAARGVKAFLRQKKDELVLSAESADNSLKLSTLDSPLTGKVAVYIEGKGKDLIFRKVNVEGSGFVVKARGVLSNVDDPQFEFQTSVAGPAKLIADIFNLPFKWSGYAQGEGRLVRRLGRTVLEADLASDDLILNSVPMGRVESKVTVGGQDGGRVELAVQRMPYPRESLDIAFGKDRLSGSLRGVHLDPIVRYFAIPWPVESPVWGDFSFENRQFQARAEFKDPLMIPGPGRFPLNGFVDLAWDGKKTFHLASSRLETSFGILAIEGDLDLDREVRVTISGDIQDVKQGREFLSLVMPGNLQIPEIRGKGRAEIKILGNYRAPQVKADFALAPGGFDKFDVQAVSGMLEIANNEVSGIFKVQDPDIRGDIHLLSGRSGLDVQIRAEDMNLEKVLPVLNVGLPVAGRAAGDFTIKRKNNNLSVRGSFSSSRAKLWSEGLKDVRGKLDWTEGAGLVAFSDLQASLYGGQIKGSGSVGYKSRDFDIDFQAVDIDLSTFYPKLEGRLAFQIKGRGSLDRDPVAGKFAVKNLRFAMVDEAQAGGDVELNYKNNMLNVKLNGVLDPGRNDFSIAFSYPQAEKSYQVNLSGHFFNFDLFLPWKGARGEVSYFAEIKGTGSAPQVSGVVDFKGPVLPFPSFPHALTDYNGLVRIQNNTASIRSIQGKLGGGDIFAKGEIRFGKGGLESLDVQADGKDMVLALLERTRALTDGSLRLVKEASRFSLSGDFLVKNLSWKRELTEKFIFSSSPYLEPKKEHGILDDLTLDIHLRADDNAVIENSMGRIRGRFDLTVTGSLASPIILGDIESLRGDVNFQDRKFRVLKARLSFFNPTSIEPYIDFQGETFLKDYRVTFSLSGLLDRLKPEFSSSPPLPPEDVLALLALGESFKRTYSSDTSSQLGTGSLLSFQLAEETQKRAERLFSLDRFRIDPFVLGSTSEMTARLTVGKKISRNIILLYSTNLSSQREEIIRLEWEFSDSFSLVGMRDERGRISFDGKVRFRF